MPLFDPQTQTFPKPNVHISPKRERFCLEYVKDYNATQAAIRAGYAPKSATSQGSDLLTFPEVQERLEELQDYMRQQCFMTVEDIRTELEKIASANPDDFFEWSNGGVSLKDSSEISRYKKAAVASIRQTVTQHGGTIELKFHSKTEALRMLGEMQGAFAGKDKGASDLRERFTEAVQEGARLFDAAKLDSSAIH